MISQKYKIIGFYLIDSEYTKNEKENRNCSLNNTVIAENNISFEEEEENLKIINQLIEEEKFNHSSKLNSIKNLSNQIVNRSEEETFNVYDLYQFYDQQFFEGLLGPIKLEWSKRMTVCAGIFSVRGNDISIRLSEPLLKFRSVIEIKETLLHEMTHAYLFMKRIEAGRDGHGPKFLEKIGQINKITGLNLTVYHTFHDEVDYYKTHIWKCNGKCQNDKPYYGFVKRSMNRPPGENDYWWAQHKANCGGTFTKISEPENYINKKKNKENSLKTIKSLKVDDKKLRKDINKLENMKDHKLSDKHQLKLEDIFKKT